MEERSIKVSRKFRSKGEIIQLLQAYDQSGQSIKSFCALHSIAEGTFHNWKHKYCKADSASEKTGFTTLQLIPEPGLFATVGSIKIYQPVSAAYLKELVP
jgi:transposase-like protein